MITTQNYYTSIDTIGVQNLPEALKKSHELVSKVTQDGSSWETYNTNATIKRVIDLYLQKLNEYAETQPKKETPLKPMVTPERRKQIIQSKKEAKEAVKREKQAAKAARKIPAHKEEETAPAGKPVERLEDEIKFIKRYAALDGKVKTDKQIMSFIDALQKAILERRIRKDSPYAQEIESIQENLVKAYNDMIQNRKYEAKFAIQESTLKRFREIAGSETPMLSIAFIKRYVGMDGRKATKEKVKKLYDQISTSIEKEKISEGDKYFDKLQLVQKGLFSYLHTSRPGALKIEKAELNGLLAACGAIYHTKGKKLDRCTDRTYSDSHRKPGRCSQHEGSLNGVGVMSSEDIANAHFDTMALHGKWKELIGDPAVGFRILIYGNPKGGKSTLAIEFAKHLAAHHGKVLYEAIEEGFGATLQEKINRLAATHPNLSFTDSLQEDLSGYDFVFIDSITKAGMNADDIHLLHEKYPRTGIIVIAQSTKDGSYKGARDLEHEVDVVIHVQDGIAKSYGRFNQGGEMRVF